MMFKPSAFTASVWPSCLAMNDKSMLAPFCFTLCVSLFPLLQKDKCTKAPRSFMMMVFI